MLALLTKFSATASVFKLIFYMLVFVGILFIAYYFTKWYANSGLVKKSSGNISIIETYQIAPGRVIYLVKIGEKYVSFVTSKEQVEFLTELKKEELSIVENLQMQKMQNPNVSFLDVISKMRKNEKKNE